MFKIRISGKLYRTNASGLWEAYLSGFPETARQHHNCNACRSFINRYGGLVTIDPLGKKQSIWFNEIVPGEYSLAAMRMDAIVNDAQVTGVFEGAAGTLGKPEAGGWHHLHADLAAEHAHSRHATSADQRFKMAQRALAEFTSDTAKQALRLLQDDKALHRSEKVLGPAKWFDQLHAVRHNRNLVWQAVATAPEGFAHVRSSMLGTLLEGIQKGQDYDTIAKGFAAKMDPTKYQRPVAPPKAGNIAVAEKRLLELGLTEAALARRMAVLDEIPMLWRPGATAPTDVPLGVFGHLAAAPAAPRDLLDAAPEIRMTVEKFVQNVVGLATKIQVYLGVEFHPTHITAAVEDTGVRLFQWGHLFSGFSWVNPQRPSSYGLAAWANVPGITSVPSSWDGGRPNHADGLVFLLEDAKLPHSPGLALFPETMRGELREVRSVIEAYSKTRAMQGLDQPNQAIGVAAGRQFGYPLRLRVDGRLITLDRWE